MRHIKSIFVGLWRLLQGMYITLLNMVRPKVTEQYPENRGKKVYPENFRALLTMPHDADNHHKCTACGICMMNCPNGTISVLSRMEADPATGRERKVLDRYVYELGSCIFCGLCTQTCPQNAIEWSNRFEHSVFDRAKLTVQLNREGSSLKPKPAPAAKPEATADGAGNPAVKAEAQSGDQAPAAPAGSSADAPAGPSADAPDPAADASQTSNIG